MSSRILLLYKRLLIFALIFALSWFTAFKFFPYIDDRLHAGLAIVITYGFIAYIGLPALARFWHTLHKPTHVPTRTFASDGWAVDAINIIVLAKNEREFIYSMQQAGWSLAQDKTIKTALHLAYSIIFNKPYANAPFGNCYVFGRKQDLGFQIPIGNSPRHRHHVRFWRLTQTRLDNEEKQHGFWRKLLQNFLTGKKEVWVGAAISDKGLVIQWRSLQVSHGVNSDTSKERDYLIGTLKKSGVLHDTVGVKAGEPLRTRHQGFGEVIIADGYVKLCELKRQAFSPAAKKPKIQKP